MWYAIAPELQIPAVSIPQETVVLHRSPEPQKARETRLFNPPAAFYTDLRLPARYRLDERGALKYIASKLHIRVRFTGPNYAMSGEKIPYDRAVPAIALLRRIAGISYIQSSVALIGGKTLVVHNAPLEP